MARRPPVPPQPQPPTVSPEQALTRLRWLRDQGNVLVSRPRVTSTDIDSWTAMLSEGLDEALGRNSPRATDILSAAGPLAFAIQASNAEIEQHLRDTVKAQVAQLDGLIRVREHALPPSDAAQPSLTASGVRIFISHRSTDAALAESLVDCLNDALVMRDCAIRCTSVPGYALD